MTQIPRTLWLSFLVVLGLLVVAGFIVPIKGHFTLDKLPLFGAWFALLVGAVLVFASRIFGALLSREEGYYD